MKEQLLGCLVGGGIGEAVGGFYENPAAAGALHGQWTQENDLLTAVVDCLPDTRVKDQLIELQINGRRPGCSKAVRQLGIRGGISAPDPVRGRSNQESAGSETVRDLTRSRWGYRYNLFHDGAAPRCPLRPGCLSTEVAGKVRPDGRHDAGGEIVRRWP